MEIMPKICLIIIACLMAILLCFTTAQTFATLNIIYDTTGEAVLSQLAVNAPAKFYGMRESSGTARYSDEDTWIYAVDDTEVENYLYRVFSLEEGGKKANNGVHQFTIGKLQTTFVNSEGNLLTFKTMLNVSIPIKLMGVVITRISQDMTVRVVYDRKY